MDKLFDTKRTYVGYDGEEYIDMCIPVVSIKKITGNSIGKLNRDYNGRLDNFVWDQVEKDIDMIDMVMYANHIFNPFAVKEGDIMNIPVSNDDLYKSNSEPSLPDGTKYSNSVSGDKEMTYAEKVEYLARKGFGLK
jgi:hypothetical protein